MPLHFICCSQSWRHSICWHLSLQCSTILFHHVQLVPFGISLWYQWSVASFRIIDSFICDIQTCTYSLWSDYPLCIFQSFILVYLVDPLVLDMQTWFTFSEHGYARLRQCFFLISFWWLGRLNSGEVLFSFWQISFPCTCLIYFGHHVPLLTSYIRGHLL